MKPLTVALLTAIVLSALTLTNITSFSNAQTGTQVNGIINQDTTWTKTNSTYNITGSVAVKSKITLTIKAGATVNLNNYYIQVNGA